MNFIPTLVDSSTLGHNNPGSSCFGLSFSYCFNHIYIPYSWRLNMCLYFPFPCLPVHMAVTWERDDICYQITNTDNITLQVCQLYQEIKQGDTSNQFPFGLTFPCDASVVESLLKNFEALHGLQLASRGISYWVERVCRLHYLSNTSDPCS